MQLKSDFTDYYDDKFIEYMGTLEECDPLKDKVFVRDRCNALNKWQALDYLQNNLQENIPSYGLPDSLESDGIALDTEVYVYLSIHKLPKNASNKHPKILTRLGEAQAEAKYRNRLCVVKMEGTPKKFIKIGDKGIWLTESHLGIPFNLPGQYMGNFPICLIDLIETVNKEFIAVDFDSCPVLSDVLSEAGAKKEPWLKEEDVVSLLHQYFIKRAKPNET